MDKRTVYWHWINISIFAFALLLHLTRAIWGGTFELAGYAIPMWVSYVAIIVLAIALYFNWEMK